MFSTYKIEQAMTYDGNIYYLQYASFTKKEVMEENVKKLDNYLLQKDNNKYYIYVGATTMLENANIIKKIFENKGIYTYIKNDYLDNNSLVNKIQTIDKKIIEENNDDVILQENNEIINLLKKGE